jgi:hypothetical protein
MRNLFPISQREASRGLILTLCVGLNLPSSARPGSAEQWLQIHKQIVIDARANDVWAAVRDFGARLSST